MNEPDTMFFPTKSPLPAYPMNPTPTITPRHLHQQSSNSPFQGFMPGRWCQLDAIFIHFGPLGTPPCLQNIPVGLPTPLSSTAEEPK